MDLSTPKVMGIINATPDSFYAGSRAENEEAVGRRAEQLVAEGADILDVGAESTRPGAAAIDADEEWSRLAPALEAVRRRLPDVPLSVDTYRASVARRAVSEFGVDLINDISCGEQDAAMFETVASLGVPYVLTSNKGDFVEVVRQLAEKLQQLYALGVADVILDPGFGFGKTLEQNYDIMRQLADFKLAFPGEPLLVGISRKSMIYRLLDTTPEQALTGTTVLNTFALQAGAHILRVHDVREAVETIKIVGQLHNSQSDNCPQGNNLDFVKS